MVKPTVFVQPPWEGPSIRLFQDFGFPVVDTMELADLVCFNGGEDLHPKLYGQTIIERAGVDWLDVERDKLEVTAYKKAKDLELFKFGICRGGQLLNVMNGGKLWQDVDGHNKAHDILDLTTGNSYWSSSVHHQQFILAPDGATMVAIANVSQHKLGKPVSRTVTWYRGAGNTMYDEDPEVVFYKEDRALCIQGHPEYGGYSKFTEYCLNDLIERYI